MLLEQSVIFGLKKEYFNKIDGLVKYLNTLGYFAATFKVLENGQQVNPDNYFFDCAIKISRIPSGTS